MAEVLAVAGSFITVATLAWDSTKKLRGLVDELNDAPKAIAHTKSILSSMDSTLGAVRHTLDTDKPAALEAALQRNNPADVLKNSRQECDSFGEKIQTLTKRSKGTTGGWTVKLTWNFHESEINRFNDRLHQQQQAITFFLSTMILIIASSSSTDIQEMSEEMSERFTNQETELKAFYTQVNNELSHLQSHSLPTGADEDDRNLDIQSLSRIGNVCRDSISAISEAKPTNLTFGNSTTDNSRHFEGVVGTAQGNVTQKHGNAFTTAGSTAARGQMEADAFKSVFGRD